MKFNIVIDCTPEEARHFMGLPEIAPMQQRLLKEMEQRMAGAVKAADTKDLLDQWMPVGMKSIDQWQAMWAQMAATAAGLQQRSRQDEKT